MTTKFLSHSLSPFFVRHIHLIKRSLTTTMSTSVEESSKTKTPDEKKGNLLAKRYIGLEKNIW